MSTGTAEDVPTAILRATTRLFEERGVDGFSMRQIAREIGYSATTIYHHFDDKDALMLAVCEDGFRAFGEELARAAREAPSPVAAIRAVASAYVGWALAHPVHYDVMFIRPKTWAIGAPGGTGPDGRRPDPESFRGLVDLVAAAVDAGDLRCEPREGAAMLWAASHGPVSLAISMGHELDGLGAEPTRARAAALVDAALESLR